ncbi:hypothetical protein VNO77_17421 [Canavalia gladiata]|uniref:Uncharacterized protein n=1 Tax=Canavalia gladiata TaxID=3824 RepID=A0AAN9LJ56_CANGL
MLIQTVSTWSMETTDHPYVGKQQCLMRPTGCISNLAGDVESVASKNQKELATLLELISSFEELKRNHEQFKEEKLDLKRKLHLCLAEE